jgi:hypothetical protein
LRSDREEIMSIRESIRGERIATVLSIFAGGLGLYGCGSSIPSGVNKLNLLNCSNGPKYNSANFSDLERGQAVDIGDVVLTSHGNGEFSLDEGNGSTTTDWVQTTGQFAITQNLGNDDPVITSTGSGQHILDLVEGNQGYTIAGLAGTAEGTEIIVTASC